MIDGWSTRCALRARGVAEQNGEVKMKGALVGSSQSPVVIYCFLSIIMHK